MLKTFSSTWIGVENNRLATKLKIDFFHTSKIERTIPYSLFRSDISICVAQSQRMF